MGLSEPHKPGTPEGTSPRHDSSDDASAGLNARVGLDSVRYGHMCLLECLKACKHSWLCWDIAFVCHACPGLNY